MHQVIDSPTRITGDSETLIDHMWLSSSLDINASGTLPGISDHLGTFVDLKHHIKPDKKTISVRVYKNYIIDKIREDYSKNFNVPTEAITVDEFNKITQDYISKLATLCEKHAPIKEFKMKSETHGVPWFDNEITSLQLLIQQWVGL